MFSYFNYFLIPTLPIINFEEIINKKKFGLVEFVSQGKLSLTNSFVA